MRLPHAPQELTAGCLRRLGEGGGKSVQASADWGGKGERTVNEIIAPIVLLKIGRRLAQVIPRMLGKRLIEKHYRQNGRARSLAGALSETSSGGLEARFVFRRCAPEKLRRLWQAGGPSGCRRIDRQSGRSGPSPRPRRGHGGAPHPPWPGPAARN